MIYLDNQNITKPCQSALDLMQELLHQWVSPSSSHKMSEELRRKLSLFYQHIYDFFGADEQDTWIFTSSGTEAINQVLFSVFSAITSTQGKNHYITTTIEEAPILLSLKRLEEQHCFVTMLEVNKEGKIDIEKLQQAIQPKTALVTLSWASGLIGSVQELSSIAQICEEKGVLLHVDVSSSAGKLALSLQDLAISYVTIDGAHIHSVRSSGGIFVKKEAPITSMIVGGIDQKQLRAGHLDVAAFCAFSESCRQANLFLNQMNMEGARLKNLFEKKVVEEVQGARVLFKQSMQLPNVSVIYFENIHAEALLYFLNEKNIFASQEGGSAQHLSKVLASCGYEEAICASSLSFSLSRYTTEEEIVQVIEALKEICPKLQDMAREIF